MSIPAAKPKVTPPCLPAPAIPPPSQRRSHALTLAPQRPDGTIHLLLAVTVPHRFPIAERLHNPLSPMDVDCPVCHAEFKSSIPHSERRRFRVSPQYSYEQTRTAMRATVSLVVPKLFTKVLPAFKLILPVHKIKTDSLIQNASGHLFKLSGP